MTDYAYRDGKKYVWPVAMRSSFNGVGGWHKLTDEQRAVYGWYPVQYVNDIYTPSEQERVLNSEGLVDGVYQVAYTVTDIPISTLIKSAQSTAQEIRNELMYKGVEYMGAVFKSDPISTAEVEGVSERYDRARPGWTDDQWPIKHNGRWRTQDNSFLYMTIEEFHGLADRLAEHAVNVAQRAHTVKDDLLTACTTKAEIDQVLEDFRNYVA